MSTKKISELETTSAVSTSDLMETAIPSGSSYASKKMSIAQLATYLENSVVHSALDTTNKTIIDAINELKSICDRLSASHFIVANQLPTSDINMNAIYLIPKQSTVVNDVYEEYICLDDTTTPATWEKIGETQIDLSNYITFDDSDIATTSKNGSMSKADRSKMNGIESGAQKNVQSDWDALSGDAFIKNKPTIPDELADLADDSTHRVVTDTEKATWNDKRAVSEIRLYSEDLNDVTTVGFYYAAGGNTVTNKPSGYGNFGLVVIHNASGSQYTQIISNENGSYRRIKKANGTWTSWAEDKFTDENVKQAILEQTDTGWHKVIIGGTSLSETTDKVNIVNGLNYRPSTGTFSVDSADGVANTERTNIVKIGNNKTKATANHVEGRIDLYGENGGYSTLKFDTTSTSHRTHTLPNKDGTIATTDDAEKVKQSPIASSNYDYRLLMSYSADDNEESQVVWKNTNLTFNPSTSTLKTYRADLGELQCTLIDFGVGSNIYGTLHGSLASSHVDVYLPVASGELALEEWQNRIGSMNLIPQNTYHKSGYTSSGATFTVNENGTVTVNRTTTTGTATFYLTDYTINGGLWLPNGTYYLKGCPVGGSSGTSAGTYQLGVRYIKNNSTIQINDDGSGVEFTINGSDISSDGAWVRVMIVLRANVSASNMLWKPMITLTSLANINTYYPPSMSNRQLTFDKFDNSNVATIENTNTASRAYAVNEFMIWHGALYRVKSAMASGATISTTYVEATTLSAQLKQIRDAFGI